jgi:hypothetical protein
LVGCAFAPGSVQTTTTTAPTATASDSPAPTIAPLKATAHSRCDPSQPFVSVKPVLGGLPGVRLTGDELTMIYTQASCSFTHFMAMSRKTLDAPFGDAASIGLPLVEGQYASITADNTRFVYATLDGTKVEMANLVDHGIDDIVTSDTGNHYGVGRPYIAPDGSAIYLDGLQRVVANHGEFAPPTKLPLDGWSPVISGDNLTLYYKGIGGGTFMSRRATVDDEFEPETTVALADVEQMKPDYASLDDCRLYLDDEDTLYVASR